MDGERKLWESDILWELGIQFQGNLVRLWHMSRVGARLFGGRQLLRYAVGAQATRSYDLAELQLNSILPPYF